MLFYLKGLTSNSEISIAWLENKKASFVAVVFGLDFAHS